LIIDNLRKNNVPGWTVNLNAVDERVTLLLNMAVFGLLGWFVALFINHAANILPTRTTLWQVPVCSGCNTRYTIARWSAIVTGLKRQRGCLHCGQPVPNFTRSVVVEVGLVVVFAALMWRYGITLKLVIVAFHTTVLALVTVTDLEHKLIFNVVMLPAILIAIAAAFFTPGLYWPSAMVGGIGAFILVYLAALLSRGGLGEGDVTLSTYLGFILGFPKILLSLTFGVFLGGFTAVILLLAGRVGLKSYIPYGPFLTLTGWIMLVWGEEIWRYYFF
jgi:prepilin signal peptidase PulO-like enzyme (type II secretory pathway)